MKLEEEGAAGAGGGSTSAGASGGSAPANVTAGVKNFDPLLGKKTFRRKKLVEDVAKRMTEKLKENE